MWEVYERFSDGSVLVFRGDIVHNLARANMTGHYPQEVQDSYSLFAQCCSVVLAPALQDPAERKPKSNRELGVWTRRLLILRCAVGGEGGCVATDKKSASVFCVRCMEDEVDQGIVTGQKLGGQGLGKKDDVISFPGSKRCGNGAEGYSRDVSGPQG
jgi:hypothetical protein